MKKKMAFFNQFELKARQRKAEEEKAEGKTR
jgi:hypothetical protein